MTLPDERYRALIYAKKFLRDLMDAKKTPRIPLELRRAARTILKHYPLEVDLHLLAKKSPDILSADASNSVSLITELHADSEIEQLRAENLRLRETLSLYADPDYWRVTQGGDEEYLFSKSAGAKVYVQGKAARAALKR